MFRRKRTKNIPPTLEAAPDHSAVRAVDPFDFQVAHKRLVMCFRISAMLNVAMGMAVCALVAALLAMMPLKEIRPALIMADSRDNMVYSVAPISPETNGFDLVLETLVRGFVVNALSIDPLSSDFRAAKASAVMSDVYQKKYLKTFVSNGWLQDVMDSGLIRSIIIESTNHIDNPSASDHLLSVDYIQTDTRDNVELERKRMRAFLKLAQRPQIVKKSEIYNNPLGIFVLDMTIKEIQG